MTSVSRRANRAVGGSGADKHQVFDPPAVGLRADLAAASSARRDRPLLSGSAWLWLLPVLLIGIGGGCGREASSREEAVEQFVGEEATSRMTRRFFDRPAVFAGEPVTLTVRVADVIDPTAIRITIPEPRDDDEFLAVHDGHIHLVQDGVIEVKGSVELFDVPRDEAVLGTQLDEDRLRAYEDEYIVIVDEFDLTP